MFNTYTLKHRMDYNCDHGLDNTKNNKKQHKPCITLPKVLCVRLLSHTNSSHSGVRYFFPCLTLLLSSFWPSRGHRCRPFFPPVLAFNFYRALGSAIPLLVDFSSSVANSRSRAFRKSICPQEKLTTNIYECALGGARTHETDLYQAQG